jgi:hypothetical protein
MGVDGGMRKLSMVVEQERVDQVGIVVGIVLDQCWEMALRESLAVVDMDRDKSPLYQVVHSLEILDYAVVLQILSPFPLPFHLSHSVLHLQHSHQTLHRHVDSAAASDSPVLPQSQYYSHSAYHSSD